MRRDAFDQQTEEHEEAQDLQASQRPVLSVLCTQAAAEEPRWRIRIEHPDHGARADVDVERTDAGGVPPRRNLHQMWPSGDLEQVVPDADRDLSPVHLYPRRVTAAAQGRGTHMQANQPVGLRRRSDSHDPIGPGNPLGGLLSPAARSPYPVTRRWDV